MVAVVFSPRYDIRFFGLERLHPFDARKYGRAWADLQRRLGSRLGRHHLAVDREASDAELLLGHTPEYLARMRRSGPMGEALGLPAFGWLPSFLARWRLATPMRWAVRGTILAARAALEKGFAINLSGGYHHAKPDHGEGFCLFSDIAIAVRQLRQEGTLAPDARIAYVDLDAHQGNGVCAQFKNDPGVFLYDQFNEDIYPIFDQAARDRIDCAVPVATGCSGGEYLALLRSRLPGFLDNVSRSRSIDLGIYNAGTDVFTGDPLGGLDLSADDVRTRDLFVIDEFRRRRVPVVMLPSGGYTRESYRLIAASVEAILEG